MLFRNRLLALCALCAIAYAPAMTIPLIGDDYPNLMQARAFASWDGTKILLNDPTFRLRSTSYWLMESIQPFAGTHAWRYHAVSVALHIICTLLLYGLFQLCKPVARGSFAAAAFFAVYEGHQEAVMWFSAVNELLLFSFGLGALICWLLAERCRWWHLPGVTLFALAILSKESAVILLPLMLLIHPRVRLSLIPYLLLGCAALASVAQSHANSFRFSDGSFSLQAPFWLTLPHSLWRLLFPWGLLAGLILWRRKAAWPPYVLSLAGMVFALLPYSFLTYSTAIPGSGSV